MPAQRTAPHLDLASGHRVPALRQLLSETQRVVVAQVLAFMATTSAEPAKKEDAWHALTRGGWAGDLDPEQCANVVVSVRTR